MRTALVFALMAVAILGTTLFDPPMTDTARLVIVAGVFGCTVGAAVSLLEYRRPEP